MYNHPSLQIRPAVKTLSTYDMSHREGKICACWWQAPLSLTAQRWLDEKTDGGRDDGSGTPSSTRMPPGGDGGYGGTPTLAVMADIDLMLSSVPDLQVVDTKLTFLS